MLTKRIKSKNQVDFVELIEGRAIMHVVVIRLDKPKKFQLPVVRRGKVRASQSLVKYFNDAEITVLDHLKESSTEISECIELQVDFNLKTFILTFCNTPKISKYLFHSQIKWIITVTKYEHMKMWMFKSYIAWKVRVKTWG